MPTQTAEHLEVLVNDPTRLYELLDDAETALRQVAMTQRSAGILVTRHNPGRYTLALSGTVPFGETHERMLSYPSADGRAARRSTAALPVES